VILSRVKSSPDVHAAPDRVSALAQLSQLRQGVIRLVTSPPTHRLLARNHKIISACE
jgi:hypothetical protein